LKGLAAGQTAIDNTVGEFEDSGPDYTQVPFQDATRYAKTGDLLELTLRNLTMSQHHPFHHHGFSFQPLRVIEHGDPDLPGDDVILYEFDYPEFIDVIDIFPGQSVVVRIRLDDRPRITDNRQEAGAPTADQYFGSGGAAGRWVFHCHLFLHAAVGMISELVVLDTDRDGDGFDTSEDCDDFDPNVQVCNEKPIANAGPDQIAECTSPAGALVTMDGTGSIDSDGGPDPLSFFWDAPGIVFDDPMSDMASATFPIGSTAVRLTVYDGEIHDSDKMDTDVVDTTAPTIDVSLDPDVLWPPNHKMHDITATVNVAEACDPNPTFVLTSITSNEPDNSQGDGNTTGDIAGGDLGSPDTEFQLRAERSGKGNGRIYTVTYTGSDGSGNSDDSSAEVTVPHNQ
jgi:hypothetical protein